jgi:hypothetical protein
MRSVKNVRMDPLKIKQICDPFFKKNFILLFGLSITINSINDKYYHDKMLHGKYDTEKHLIVRCLLQLCLFLLLITQ